MTPGRARGGLARLTTAVTAVVAVAAVAAVASVTAVACDGPSATPPGRAPPVGEIVYALRHEGRVELRAVSSAGGAPRLVARDPVADLYPGPGAWPIAVATRGVDEAHVEQLRVGGSLAAQGPTAGRVRNPAATRDGRTIYFEADHESFRSLYRLDVASGAVTRLTFDDAGSFEPSPSPDGTRVAFASSRSGQPEIYVMDADGSDVRVLAASPREDVAPVWSPDGHRVTFASSRAGNDRLYVVPTGVASAADTAAAEPRRVTDEPADGPAVEADAVWSPDGRHLAYTRVDGELAAVHVVGVDDGAAARSRRVSAADAAYADQPTWSPDGRHLAFVVHDGDLGRLVVVRADGTGARTITPAGELSLPRWR